MVLLIGWLQQRFRFHDISTNQIHYFCLLPLLQHSPCTSLGLGPNLQP
jgi:hypothetical protein